MHMGHGPPRPELGGQQGGPHYWSAREMSNHFNIGHLSLRFSTAMEKFPYPQVLYSAKLLQQSNHLLKALNT